ncbi:MAG: TonB-dependent receptor [Marinifilaceae bacterium]|jgi:hypothetical protein|nr:TonB-dependent receptor [Marinifilaceae bacterium]
MKHILIYIFIFLGFTSLAQNKGISLEAKIKDENKKPMVMANVIAINTESKKMETYCVSSNQGFFRLKLQNEKKYIVKISFIGYKTIVDTIETKKNIKSKIIKSYQMQASDSELNQINVSYTMPVSVKGDTIVYDADSFKTGTEKKLIDVLENLPGVEINEEGQIEVEGKKVQKLLVEGKEFFDGDSKLAANNLPSNSVDKVQVLRNYNEINQMKGLSFDEDNIALNIKLKEGMKNLWFGESKLSAGTNEEYLASTKLFYYNPKFSANIIGDLNNIGEMPFSRRDFMNFTGGFKNMHSRSGSNFSQTNNNLGINMSKSNNSKQVESKFGAFNFSYSASESFNLGGFGIYSYNKDIVEKNIERNYKLQNDKNNNENITNHTNQETNLNLYKLNAVYSPNEKLHINYDGFIKYNDDKEEKNIISSTKEQEKYIIENKKQKPLNVKQSAELYFTANKKNIIAANALFEHKDESPLYRSITDQFGFKDIINVSESGNTYDISQNKKIRYSKLDVKFDYFYLLNDKSNLQLSFGNILNTQKYNTSIFQNLSKNNTIDFKNDELTNDVKYSLSDIFTELHYKVQLGDIIFNPGIGLHKFRTKYESANSKNDEFYELLPDIYINWQMRKSQNLRFKYSITRNYTDITKYSEGLVLENYNALYKGNSDLKSSKTHKYSLSFFSFNMFNYTHMFANLTYTKKINGVKSNSEYFDLNRISSSINSNQDDESLYFNSKYSRKFKYLKLGAKFSYNWSKSYNIVNSEESKSQNNTINYNAYIGTNFSKIPNIKVGYNYIKNKYKTNNQTNSYYTNKPYIRLDACFLKNFILTANYDLYSYESKDKNVDENYDLFEAELTYQKQNSHWEFGVSAKNISNSKQSNTSSENDYYIETIKYTSRNPNYMLSIKYNF